MNFPANAVTNPATVNVTPIASANLTVPITRGIAHGRAFTPNANNTYITAFQIDVSPTTFTKFNAPVTVSATGVTSLAAGTVLYMAQLVNNQWTDVGTLLVDNSGNVNSQVATFALPGALTPGTYVIYQAGGATTSLANFGVVLVANDSSGNSVSGGALQVINLYDASGAILSTPSIKSLAFAGAGDLDGQAMTPDGKYGILVDGGNTVRFFSNVNTGVPIASTQTVDISQYGGDGDSVAIMPLGDTAVIAGDTNKLLVISGISAGAPAAADTITLPDDRDGVAISNDGKVLLARGRSGLTVFSIAPVAAPVAGSLGGQNAYTFTQTTNIPGAGVGGLEDGRDGMAISPTDSSRAVVVGASGASVDLYTGLPNNTVQRSVPIHVPASSARVLRSGPRRSRASVTPTGAFLVSSVAITPDGKYAVVGTDAGLALFSGVDTGNLTQVGTLFNPMFTVNGTSLTLGRVPSLTITLDGKYVIACAPQPSPGQGTMLVIPFTASGFGAPVGQLNGLAIPSNDQILIH